MFLSNCCVVGGNCQCHFYNLCNVRLSGPFFAYTVFDTVVCVEILRQKSHPCCLDNVILDQDKIGS